jgi:hypothetical protein
MPLNPEQDGRPDRADSPDNEPRPMFPIGLVALVGGVPAALLVLFTVLAVGTWALWREWHDPRLVELQRAQLGQVQTCLMGYESRFGEWPPSPNSEMARSLQTTERRGPFIEISTFKVSNSGEILDVWGKPIVYGGKARLEPNRDGSQLRPVLYSVGPNGRDEGGQGDDINQSQ